MILNTDLILYLILPGLINSTIVSVVIAIVVGGIVGLIFGVRSRPIKSKIVPAIQGSFLGTMLIAMLPLVSQPGIWGNAYGGIIIMLMSISLIPTGSILGATLACLYFPTLLVQEKRKILLYLLIGIYTLIPLISYLRIAPYCVQYPFYCHRPY